MRRFSQQPTAAVTRSDDGAFFVADAEEEQEEEESDVKRDINSTVSLDKYTRLWPLHSHTQLRDRGSVPSFIGVKGDGFSSLDHFY